MKTNLIGALIFAATAIAFCKADEPQRVVDSNPAVSFTTDIQPIFARACTGCHGGVKQAADISFVSSDSILPPEGWIVEPGDAEASVLMERITTSDPDSRMPPPEEHADPLSEQEIDLIRRWINDGAKWEDHWARRPLARPKSPSNVNKAGDAQPWGKQPLDAFVLERLTAKGLQPSSAAEPSQWLRRASLDLIGLPPTLAELDAFLSAIAKATSADAQDAVYLAETDRLLASNHFGERWAAMWMDLARYADSKGFEKDPHRDIWPYRDWLIEAFNEDMPYDQFTIKQLAGDLMPDATAKDLIATAFHRNTQTNTEGGTDDEEFRIAAVIDRLSTTWTTWQATTFGCVQCHAHPYEPFEHKEFYAGLSLFNNTEDVDLNSDAPTVPYIVDPSQAAALVQTERTLRDTRDKLDSQSHAVIDRCEWKSVKISQAESTSGQLGVVGDEVRVVGGTVSVGSTYTLTADEPPSKITALRIWIRPESDNPAKWPEQGSVLSHLKVRIVPAEGEAREIPLRLVIPDHRSGIAGIENANADKMLQTGPAGFGGYPKLLRPRWVVVILAQPVELDDGDQLSFTIHNGASVTGGLSNHIRRMQIDWTDSVELANYIESPEFKHSLAQVAELHKKWNQFKGTRVAIMQERSAGAARETRVFLRGNWLERGEVVEPGIPKVFQATSARGEVIVSDRLEFARWLVSKENPLAARVWVNRIWSELFGRGIVETLEDFGVSGLPPSHPNLLAHLAITMRDDYRWSLKSLLRSLVLSATYRQDSRASETLRELDPGNRLFARGPRTRLTAEMVRDQALVAAETMTDKMGGPSVMPPQPDGIWMQVYAGAKWNTATGPDRFRRGVYTYWKRTSPYPSFITFDAPNRDVCSARRLPTNTPLQALVTMNSEVYTELAAKLATLCRKSNDRPIKETIAEMFLRITTRKPSDQDLADLIELYESLGRTTNADNSVDPLAVVALAILNSDWAFTK